jgi:16S rRNA G966 N2-methylase RsmD
LNPEILKPEIQKFINDNINSDTSKLLFKGSPFDTVTIQELVTQIISKKKCIKKLPTWFKTKNIYFPLKVHIEQTSSEITANYKASLVSGDTIIDITGGLGVDCFYFAKKMNQVTYCELNTKLLTISRHNFNQLKINNLELFSVDGIEHLHSNDIFYDWIYIDPSRRDSVDKKVFLLKDCLPDVPENLDVLMSRTTKILIKTSPILDISRTIKELRFVKEIHIVAIDNEVKELLFILEKNGNENLLIKTINFNKNSNQLFDFNYFDSKISNYSEPKKYIYEPNSAILKSGGFHEVGHHFNLNKLHKNAHLYTSENLIKFPGRTFILENICSYNKKEISTYLKDNKANITTRNFPETVAQIRKKTGIKDGGNTYLFFTTNYTNKHIVLICSQSF